MVMDPPNISIVPNYSKLILTPAMTSALEYNLNFVSSPHEVDVYQLMVGVDNYLRQIRHTVHFDHWTNPIDCPSVSPSTSTEFQSDYESNGPTFDHYKFHNASKFDPKSEYQPALDTY